MQPMDRRHLLNEQFEISRTHLRTVAFRMLGSAAEADDVVQEVWLRLNRADTSGIENLGGWLTTIAAHICLDMLRTRASRREESLNVPTFDTLVSRSHQEDPEHEALLADSLGLALLVVLDTLAPAERLAFVLHDVFAVPFDEIAPIVERSPEAARQLASRARRRVRGATTIAELNLARQRTVVDAFLRAAREGDFGALLQVLDPDVVGRADSAAVALGGPSDLRGAVAVAKQFSGSAHSARPALVNGSIGAAIIPNGRLLLVLGFTIADGKIVAIDVVADPVRLGTFELVLLDDGTGS
jgi:RNA polymerase sigma factor (sigma-70 family)